MACIYCSNKIYIKADTYTKSLLAPRTRVEALMQQLVDLTGEFYIPIEARYCPMCGEETTEGKIDK